MAIPAYGCSPDSVEEYQPSPEARAYASKLCSARHECRCADERFSSYSGCFDAIAKSFDAQVEAGAKVDKPASTRCWPVRRSTGARLGCGTNSCWGPALCFTNQSNWGKPVHPRTTSPRSAPRSVTPAWLVCEASVVRSRRRNSLRPRFLRLVTRAATSLSASGCTAGMTIAAIRQQPWETHAIIPRAVKPLPIVKAWVGRTRACARCGNSRAKHVTHAIGSPALPRIFPSRSTRAIPPAILVRPTSQAYAG